MLIVFTRSEHEIEIALRKHQFHFNTAPVSALVAIEAYFAK
jgi:hypothetical protein